MKLVRPPGFKKTKERRKQRYKLRENYYKATWCTFHALAAFRLNVTDATFQCISNFYHALVEFFTNYFKRFSPFWKRIFSDYSKLSF